MTISSVGKAVEELELLRSMPLEAHFHIVGDATGVRPDPGLA
jgi:hypothetical protein